MVLYFKYFIDLKDFANFVWWPEHHLRLFFMGKCKFLSEFLYDKPIVVWETTACTMSPSLRHICVKNKSVNQSWRWIQIFDSMTSCKQYLIILSFKFEPDGIFYINRSSGYLERTCFKYYLSALDKYFKVRFFLLVLPQLQLLAMQ